MSYKRPLTVLFVGIALTFTCVAAATLAILPW